MNKKLFVILFTCFLSILKVNAQDFNFLQEPIPTELKQNANAVVRLEATTINLNGIANMEITYNRVVTVFNKEGNKLVKAYVGYDDSRKITSIQANVYNYLGNKIKKVKPKEFKDVSATDGGTLYSDSRIQYFEFTPTQYPYTVHFSYTLKTPITVFIPSWTPVTSYYESVEKSTYTINNNTDTELFFKNKNFEGYTIDTTSNSTKTSYKITNLKALKREYLSPSIHKVTPVVLVAPKKFNANGVRGEASNWQEYGIWMHEKILSGRNKLTPETITLVKKLTQGIEDPLEKAKTIYKYVQDNTRYISVQVGIGGYQPISAFQVDKVKYGDCKGLTNYTQALLEVVGVPSYYTHVESGRKKENMEQDFASLSQGDHVILNIPYQGKDYWLDCTSQLHPFNFVGDFTDDRDVLVITPKGGILKRTPKYLDSVNLRTTTGKIKLSQDGSIQGNLQLSSKGIVYDNRFFLERLSEEDYTKQYKYYWDYINNLHINNASFQNIKDSVLFKENLDIEAQSYGVLSGKRMLVAPNIFDKEVSVPDRYRNRLLDFEIQRGSLQETAFEIQIPEGYQIEAIPDNLNAESKYGTYTASVAVKNNTIYYKRSYLQKHGNYSKTEYKAYRDFKRKVARFDNSKIVLIKTTK